jgi:hypothetical protein
MDDLGLIATITNHQQSPIHQSTITKNQQSAINHPITNPQSVDPQSAIRSPQSTHRSLGSSR